MRHAARQSVFIFMGVHRHCDSIAPLFSEVEWYRFANLQKGAHAHVRDDLHRTQYAHPHHDKFAIVGTTHRHRRSTFRCYYITPERAIQRLELSKEGVNVSVTLYSFCGGNRVVTLLVKNHSLSAQLTSHASKRCPSTNLHQQHQFGHRDDEAANIISTVQ